MKHLLTLLLPAMLLITACEKNDEYYPAGQTILTSIKSSDWRLTDQGRTYAYDISVPEISYDFNEYGAVLVYLSFDGFSYEQIPQVFNGESYSFTTDERVLTINKQRYDGSASPERPPYVDVKIVLIDSY